MPQRKINLDHRQELAKNLSDVAEYRRMPFLRGGLRIFNDTGQHGKVVGGSGAGYVLIKFHYQRWLHIYHPTWELAYFDKQGHILADYRTEQK